MMSSEAKLHEIVEKLRGEWEIRTDWGKIRVAFRPLRIHYGSAKGVPDELIIVEVSFPLLGEWVFLQAPVLLEVEEKGGISASLEDLRKFAERSQAGEQESHVTLPMIVIGNERKSKTKDILLNIIVDIKEIPKSLIHN
jgi:hypothetical protein